MPDALLVVCLILGLLILAGGFAVANLLKRVPDGMIGVVYRRFGRADPRFPFQVQVAGGSGYQATTLSANRFYLRPRLLYRVEYVPRTHVPAGTIGVVLARDGQVPPPHQTLCRPVECHYFQDGRGFLLGGGQQGRQLAILPGGASYDINPQLFEVITVYTVGEGRYDLTEAHLREITIPEGSTGVVIVREGLPADENERSSGPSNVGPVIPGHYSFQLPAVFLQGGGRRGAQAETLTHGGVYRINPWFARVVLIPTRDLILEWTRRDKSADNFDLALDQIRINVEGHWLRFDMSQTIRIPARSAPGLVGRFGEQETDGLRPARASDRAPVQRFVEKVLGRTVEGYFQSTATEYTALEFIARHAEVRQQVQDQIRQALAEWGVIAVLTTLNEFEPEGANLHDLLRALASEREQGPVLELERQNEVLRADRDRIRIGVDVDRAKVELRARIELLGTNAAAAEIFLTQLAQMNVPNVLSAGGGADELLKHLPLTVALNMINTALGRPDAAAPLGPPVPAQIQVDPT